MSKKTGILANEGRAHAAARIDARYTRQFAEDLKWLASDARGRRLLARTVFNICGVMITVPWTPSAEIHFVAGKRAVGEHLLGILEEAAPAETRKMLDEWFNDRFEWRADIERAAVKPNGDDDE